MKVVKNDLPAAKEVTKPGTALEVKEKSLPDVILDRVQKLQAEGGISFPVNYSVPNAQQRKSQRTALEVKEKSLPDVILDRVQKLQAEGGISFPVNYSVPNALKSAWLILQDVVDKDKKKALTVCSKESIANSLLNMVIQGLSPAKKQCYFVVFGTSLNLMRSYMGTVAVTKRLEGVEDVFAHVIYEDDVFKYKFDLEAGVKTVIQHDQEFENIDLTKIKGAYAIIKRTGKPNFVEIMNLDQIKKAWMQGAAKGNSPAHQNFNDEMCKKTVINRACKMFFNTSDDSDLLIEAINNTLDNMATEDDYVEVEVKNEIAENANSQEIDIVKPEAPQDAKPANKAEAPKGDLFGNPDKKNGQRQTEKVAADGPGY